jgi:hypothetical protein
MIKGLGMTGLQNTERHCLLERKCSIDVYGREGTIECVGDYEPCMFLKLRQKVPAMPQNKFLRCEYKIKEI